MTSKLLSSDDVRFLERTIELAERGRGTTRPNPLVGCVVVGEDGAVVGEGWHERAGEPHAEAHALAQSGGRAAGSTVYVSLEPCAHHGATPPCTEALLAAGVKRVVCGSLDPNPRVDGRGIDRLRSGGVVVDVADGDLEWRARAQNEAFRTWIVEDRPFVTYKAAMTLDGRLAPSSGNARWISGEESRRRVHELRAVVDAVAVGGGTARADAPELTARDVGAARQPRRLVFSSDTTPIGDLEVRAAPLDEELRALAAEGVQSLLLEGGATLAGAFLREGLIDKLMVFIAPTVLGGDDGAPLFKGPGASDMGQALGLKRVTTEQSGNDLLVVGYLRLP